MRLIRPLVDWVRIGLLSEDQIALGGELEWDEERQELRRADRPSS
jgi:hypothetical protein